MHELHAGAAIVSTTYLRRRCECGTLGLMPCFHARCAGISRDSSHKRRATGGKQSKFRKKRK